MTIYSVASTATFYIVIVEYLAGARPSFRDLALFAAGAASLRADGQLGEAYLDSFNDDALPGQGIGRAYVRVPLS